MAITRSLMFVMTAACVTPIDEGAFEQAIVGGAQTTTTQFPTVVGLQAGAGNWFCTGVLIDKDWVLTVASCFDGITTAEIKLDDNTIADGGGTTIAVAEIHKHPSFNINSTTWIHDVAMLKLSQSVTDRTPSPLRRDAVPIGSSLTQVGFGVNSNSGGGGGVLRSLNTTTLDCAQANDSGITNANLLCFDADDGTSSCYGDGGAPAFLGGAVAGLVSGGTESSCTDGLDISTALMPELAFIDSKLPVTTPPTEEPTDPVTPPSDDPDQDSDPVDPDDDDDDGAPPTVRGCSTGGSTGGLVMMLGLALLALRRRR
jgi:MYXO-CTERM domain-containing protein